MSENQIAAAMPLDREVDVAIVGGGMVGQALACGLGSSALSVAVIDPLQTDAAQRLAKVKSEAKQGFDPRVSALSLASEQILRSLDAWPTMELLRVEPYQRMRVWDGEGTAEISFSAAEQHQSHLGHLVENRVTLAGLQQSLEQHDNIEWLGGRTIATLSEPEADGLDSWRILSLDDGSRLKARLVVAADGARSATRHLAGMPLSEWDYQHHAIVTTITTEQPHQQTAWQRFTEDGPLALLPLAGDGHQLSIVWSTSPNHADALMAMDDAAFSEALGQAFEFRLGRITEVDPRFKFPLTQRHAKDYVAPSLALVGDAAHTIHPLAGQGVNLGLLDAATLAEELLASSELGLPLGELQRLRRYQRRRQGENLQMMATMAAFRHLYGEVPPVVHWLRNVGMKQVAATGPLKRLLVRHALGLEGDLPQLARRPLDQTGLG
ncbi:FAD-dependent monooxygenase [Motiliproteus sp.]|uniref:FAD-dependent monooxygenase n=1 Tax=Motiliproteus sp. TaxID=1898955 RepID=UPI003BAAE1B5